MPMILQADAYTGLKQLPEGAAHCICTSPPYFNLRDYGTDPIEWPPVTYSIFGFEVSIPAMTCELGKEDTPRQFVGHLVSIFREARRVLRNDGTLWINIGDSYASQSKNRTPEQAERNSTLHGSLESQSQSLKQKTKVVDGLKAKDQIGIPWMLAFALRDDGWYLRQEIIWSKPNCMPESVTDRCTKSHEHIFMLSKSKKYYFDSEAIKTDAKESSILRASQDTANQIGGVVPGKRNGNMKAVLKGLPEGQANIRKARSKQRDYLRRDKKAINENYNQFTIKANKRSVWHVSPAQYNGDHFAVFPEELIVDIIKAGCPFGGVVLDPFFGRGTTGSVARKLNRNFIGIELSQKNVVLAEKYLHDQLGMFI